MATEETYREAHRRSHKLLGAFLALWGWTNNVDCVVLPRGQLLPFLGLKRMQNKRIQWVKEDVRTLFPYSWTTVMTKTKIYATLYLSRLPMPPAPQHGSMSDEKRAAAFKAEGLNTGIVKIPAEREIVSMMASLVHGIGDFSG